MRHKNIIDLKIGTKLKNARIACGYTQEQVAEKVNCATRYMGQLETNRTFGSIGLLVALCNLYNITLNDLYGEYLTADSKEGNNSIPSIIGYSQLNDEYRAIVDNNIQFLNSLQNKAK